MRIRFYTRSQAARLALCLFLGIFALGLSVGLALPWVLSGQEEPVAAFAPLEDGPVLDLFSSAAPAPTLTPTSLPTSLPFSNPDTTPISINLFTFETPSPQTMAPSQSPAALTPSLAPPVLPTPTLAPGEFHIEVVQGPGVGATTGKKRVLIYHTHTYEAYTPTEKYPYEPTKDTRTKDNQYNVVRVGEELATLLSAAGFEVVHDTTAYEPPVLSTSYTRSLNMLEESIGRGEKYDLYIDLHRDAGGENNIVQVGDQRIARMMILIGNGAGVTSAGFDVRPDWEKNLAIAQAITNELNGQVPELCRPVKVTKNRYNQHVAPQCILIEAGNDRNTLEEVLASVPYLSDAIKAVLTAPEASPAPEGQ
jgi:stage II sporulation protein P